MDNSAKNPYWQLCLSSGLMTFIGAALGTGIGRNIKSTYIGALIGLGVGISGFTICKKCIRHPEIKT